MAIDFSAQPDQQSPAMVAQAMASYVRERLEDRVLDTRVAYGQLTLTVAAHALPAAARLCKQDRTLAFDFFDFMSGVDERERGLAVVTHLYSTTRRHHIQLRAIAEGGREAPVLPSIAHLYAGAIWHEREVYDMFGIRFEGHPGLEPRILTVENFEGWPLRKEFLLSTREAKPWPGLKEPKEPEPEESEDGEEPAASGPSAEEKAAAAKAKVERAKEKAAAMRKKKAQERAAEQREAAAGLTVDAERPAETTAAGEAAVTPEKPDDERAPGPVEHDQRAESAEQTLGGQTTGTSAAAGQVAAGDAPSQSPGEAAELAQTSAAKDAAAGAPSGDTAKGAPQDAPGEDQPVADTDEEHRVAEGARATAGGAPGVEAEGRHGGAVEQTGDRPASETPGMSSPTQDEEEAARGGTEPPQPPRGTSEETPRFMRAGTAGNIETTTLAESIGETAQTGPTQREDELDPHLTGTDAADRIAGLQPDDAASQPEAPRSDEEEQQ